MAIQKMKTQLWMAVVAGVAFGLGAYLTTEEGKRRSAVRYREALRHAKAAGLTPLGDGIDMRPVQHGYHQTMMRKWIEASRHPWRPVAPDPPEPK